MKFPLHAQAAQIEAFGPPADVIQLKEVAIPQPGPHQVLIRMKMAPIHPADINQIEGTYAHLPKLPATIGNEGVGEVVEVGPEVKSLKPGSRVILPMGGGTWQQFILIHETYCLPIPHALSDTDAAMLSINPLTAWLLLHHIVSLKPGNWILQNAANSAVGRSVIQIARYLGYQTINLVRRKECIQELESLGANIVLTESSDIKEIQSRLPKESISLALNAVSGESAIQLMELLSSNGTLVTYGAMSKQALKVPNRFLIFKNLTLRGFWLRLWYQKHAQERFEIFNKLIQLATEGKLTLPIDSIFPLIDIHEALRRAQTEARQGKVLLDLR